MSKNRKKQRESQKNRIRTAYEHRPEDLIVIPADPELAVKTNVYEQELRVAPYCRVSTQEEAQAASIELQKQHFLEQIAQHANWTLVDVYYDDGRSATSIRGREDFSRLMEDCRAGKIDLILTKAVSRFARNVVDCLSCIRELRGLDPPVGVYFEDLGMNTLGQTGEMLVAIMAAVAQVESENKSVSIAWGFRRRFDHGLPKWSGTYGYEQNDGGDIQIVTSEAEVVRLIYQSYLQGFSVNQIADMLSASSVETYYGAPRWNAATVRYMLGNEKYCGDAAMQKTFRVDIFTHRSAVNRGQLPKYYKKNCYPPIVSRDIWEAVQRELQMRSRSTQYALTDAYGEQTDLLYGFQKIVVKGKE